MTSMVEYIEAQMIESTRLMKELGKEWARTSSRTNPIRKIDLTRQRLRLLTHFFEAFDRSNAIAITQTDNDGKFTLDLPDVMPELLALFAFLEIKIGDDEKAYAWVVESDQLASPIMLTDENRYQVVIR